MKLYFLDLLKRLFVALHFFLYLNLSNSVLAQTGKADPIRDLYTAEQISPSSYAIHGPLALPNAENQGFMNNPAFVVGDNGIIVIDAGGTLQTGEMVLGLIKSIRDLPVVATFSTHIHGDHWLGNQAIVESYPEAKHYAHQNLIHQANSGEGKFWVDTMNTLTEGASLGTMFHTPDSPVNDGDQFSIAGKSFSVYHNSIAHTDTDIALRFDDENIIFMGDTALNGRLGRLDDGNFKGLIAFLNRLLALEGEVYVPGHGKTGDRAVATAYKEMMEIIYNTVETEYENGLTGFEIKPIIEKRLLNNNIWIDLDSSLGKLISLGSVRNSVSIL